MSVRIYDPDPDLLRLRREYGALRFERAMLKFELAIKDYRDQPRVPAGSSEGGRWTSGGGEGSGPGEAVGAPADKLAANQSDTGWRTVSETRHPDGTVAKRIVVGGGGVVIGSEFPLPGDGFDVRHTVRAADGTIRSFETTGHVQTIYDESGQAVSRTVWTRNGPEAADRIQPAFLVPLAPLAAEKTIAAAITLYGYYLTLQGDDRKAVIAFKAREYAKVDGPELKLEFVGLITRQEAKNACPALDDMQGALDDVVTKMKKTNGSDSPAVFGTKVHKELKSRIDGWGDPKLLAEFSMTKSDDADAYYGVKDSLRADGVENASETTTCIHDFKTGGSRNRLSFGRSTELAELALRKFPKTKTMIVIELRPR